MTPGDHAAATIAAAIRAERYRAAAILGRTVTITAAEDRLGADANPRGPNACPTCRDGILTIADGRECRACRMERRILRHE